MHALLLLVQSGQFVLQHPHLRAGVGTAGQHGVDGRLQLLDLQVGLEGVDAAQNLSGFVGLPLLDVEIEHLAVAF